MIKTQASELINQSRPITTLVLFALTGAVIHLAASLSIGENKVEWSIEKQKQQIEELEKMRVEGINKQAASEIERIREWKAHQRQREEARRRAMPDQTEYPRMEDLPE